MHDSNKLMFAGYNVSTCRSFGLVDKTLPQPTTNQTVYEGLGKDETVWASAMRAVCGDHVQMCELRKWTTPMTQSLIDNNVDEQIIDSLMKTIQKNVRTYRRYLKLKAKIMGLRKLAKYDIVAPLLGSPEASFTWTESRKEAEAAYGGFDPQISKWIVEMYERRHLDGEVRKGKTSGVFCSPWLAGKSAYILQSFNNRMGDIYTQAHELGHAIHDYLASRALRRLGICCVL